MASAIAPQVGAFERGQRERAFIADLIRLPKQARVLAMESGEDRQVTFDAATRRFEIQSTQFRSEIPSSDIQITLFRRGSEDLGEADWNIRCTADGRCDPGGLQINLNGRLMFVQVESSGNVITGDGEIPPFSSESWPAGDFEIRGGSGIEP